MIQPPPNPAFAANSFPRHRGYHNIPKAQITGHKANLVPPTRKPSNSNPRTSAHHATRSVGEANGGDRILISNLPPDVRDEEVLSLFSKTVGPVLQVSVMFSWEGQPLGLAVVHFKNAADAEMAREKYNGKLVDGTIPIKVEIVGKNFVVPQPPPPPAQPPSLLERMSVLVPEPTLASRIQPLSTRVSPRLTSPVEPKAKNRIRQPQKQRQRMVSSVKKGRKPSASLLSTAARQPVLSVAELDRQMDEYNAAPK